MIVLVVCVGNLCRSPMAQALLRQALPDLTVWSAGLAAPVGAPADPRACAVAADAGLDLTGHRAEQLTGVRISAANLVLVMDEAQKSALQLRYPMHSGRVFRLGDRTVGDVADPRGRSRTAFEHAFACLGEGVRDWAPRIRALQRQDAR
ncbi:low molecular weight phosphotyrosine protein phosphatase [Cupriavidus pauculus]|uniref:protein-tyrosine-phosphatase n=2 Tax=Cupriavidus pauculus TaxID=82633 RepID=A0A3G8H585_9BURK|nr:low molecular weight protein-tyrosine-phosphatase [Cupriavidus pauculus]AZG14692.1 low molecular weight phosphotyrosine protein phosphatase [Cupriavidus pauculus]